jgi:putative chitinase
MRWDMRPTSMLRTSPIARTIRDSPLTFDLLILENNRCVHISFHPDMRRQVLRQPGGPGSTVFPGLDS